MTKQEIPKAVLEAKALLKEYYQNDLTRPPRECPVCEEEMINPRPNRRFCTRHCKDIWKNEEKRCLERRTE